MTAAANYRIEHVAETPRGYQVRTFAPGPRSDHLVTVAFPKGARRRGSGQLVEILHPRGENPCRFNPDSHRIVWLDEMVRRLERDYRGWRKAGMSEGEALERTLASSTAGPAAIAELKRRIGSNPDPRDPMKFIGEALTRKQKDYYLAQYDYWLNVEGATEEKSERYALEDLLKKFPRLARKNPEEELRLLDSIRHGDRVTILIPAGMGRGGQEWKPKSGRAVMRGPAGWVLNMGGAHGTPGVATERNIVSVRRSNPDKKDRPKRGESVPDYHARRVRELLAKMPKPIRDVFDQNPASYKFVFRNPGDGELADAESLYEEFHGRAPREILEMQESSETRGEYTALGELVELTMIAPTGDRIKVQFKGDGVRVASSPQGEQLYLLGGNQDLSGWLEMFGADERKDLIDLGEAKQIVYEAAKWQTNFTPQEWKHDFGEESGVRPRGFYDQLKKRIFFAGGTYQIKRPGIID